MKQFINPHAHSHYSLDGAASVEEIIKKNIELGANAVALTEHGNLNSAAELYFLCKKYNVLPILGIEAYVPPLLSTEMFAQMQTILPSDEFKKIHQKKTKSYCHLTIHFKTYKAFQYFCSLSKKAEENAIVKFGEKKPLIFWDDLEKIKNEVTVGSSCLIGPVASLVHTRHNTIHFDLAEQAYCFIREFFGKDNFFVEIFPHELKFEWTRAKIDKETKKIVEGGQFKRIGCNHLVRDGDLQNFVNNFLLFLAKKYKDRVLISLDSHFAVKDQKITQDVRLGNGQEQWKFFNSYHILDVKESSDFLKQKLNLSDLEINEFIENSYWWSEKFKDFKMPTSSDRWILPTVHESNWQNKIYTTLVSNQKVDFNDSIQVNRLKKEINVLSNNGKINLMPYFFTVLEIIEFCKKNGILYNIRGSGAGSFLLYALGINRINPLKHQLSFERFLTIGRIHANTLPDIDIDIASQHRDRVLKFLEERYQDCFCRISTDSTIKLKSAIKDSERFLRGSVSAATELLCKKLPAEPPNVSSYDFVFGYVSDEGKKIAGLFDTNEDLKKFAKDAPEVWESVKHVLGTIRQKSIHACGVVIADQPIQNLSPLVKINGTWATGFSPKSLDILGLVKFDLLSVNSLTDIQNCLELIYEKTQKKIDIYNLPIDIEVFKLFWSGKTVSIFQFDTDTVRPYLKIIKPTNLDDLGAITALCRPGTLDALDHNNRVLSEVFVKRATGEEPIEYVHPALESILKETYGIALYQEQTIEIFKKLANYSDEEAENVRRGIGKKDEKILSKCFNDLAVNCLKQGFSEKEIDLLRQQILSSARYAFNKSHAISYAYIAYACAYLKHYHPLEWWTAVLNNATLEEIQNKFWFEIKDLLEIPLINISKNKYVVNNSKIVPPLHIIKGIGEKTSEVLSNNAPYVNVIDFLQKNKDFLDVGILKKLFFSGAIDELFDESNISCKLKVLDDLWKKIITPKNYKNLHDEFKNFTFLDFLLLKKQLLPFYGVDWLSLFAKNLNLVKYDFFYKNPANNKIFLTGNALNEIVKSDMSTNNYIYNNITNFSTLGYVIDERPFRYHNNLKQANELTFESNGFIFSYILWPSDNEIVKVDFIHKITEFQFFKKNQKIYLKRAKAVLLK